MSTIIQTCLESQVLKLKISASNIDEINNNQLKMKNISANTTEYGGGSSFLEYLSNISSTPEEIIDKENVYIHTLSKSASSSRLSEKSLQLCTENLGCETGSFMTMTSEISNILSMSSSRKEHEEKKITEKEVKGSCSYSYSIKKVKSFSAFPPPLTTMCGEKALQFKSIREGGRLITRAVEITSQESCFVADRSDGRLRLSLFNDFGTIVVDDVQVVTPEQEQEDEDEDKEEEEIEMIMNKKHSEDYECRKKDDDDEDDDDDAKCNQIMSKELVEVENLGKEKFRRFIRCKECNKGISNWEPMWVATS